MVDGIDSLFRSLIYIPLQYAFANNPSQPE